MSFVDVRVVAYVVVLAAAYAIFATSYGVQPLATTGTLQPFGASAVQHTDDAGFFDTIKQAVELNIDTPELFFINSILFSTLAILIVFVGLRYVRGTG